jgi:sulfotransferase family protein
VSGLRVVGAGLGRTGTNSLKLALERLTGGPCYHMLELFEHHDDLPKWRGALRDDPPDWGTFPAGYTATVDWPACAFWAGLAAAHPDAIVLLSLRDSAEQWWRSFEATILEGLSRPVPADQPEWAERRKVTLELLERTFTPDWRERAGAMAGYEAHNAAVRETIPTGRLVEWRPGDGWEPICAALDVPVPDEPFPHVNTTEEFRAADQQSRD